MSSFAIAQSLEGELEPYSKVEMERFGWASVRLELAGRAGGCLFITQLKAIVEENMSDAEFGVNELCKAMGVSRSVLHRKLKVLANTYTTSFIRTLRLHKARQLLKKTENSISGVAYDVGYFSRVFRKEFGASPRAFREGL